MSRAGRKASQAAAFAPAFYVLCGISFLCVLLLIVRADRVGFEKYGFLLWNLFLAWLPLIVSMAASGLDRLASSRRLGVLPLLVAGVAWMLLYPNAPYLTTDLIHLIANPQYTWINASESLLVWYDLIVFFLFAWCGLLLGYLSMHQFHQLVRKYAGVWFGWLFIVGASFLGGFGVYLGRAIRLNSWDVLFSPFRLIDGILEGLDANGAAFTVLFGMLILIVYLSLFCLRLLAGRIDEAES
ncbi:DUF1361 domain-containing protein [Cohnella nanjingensis]|uniref:DUF1361 domain-containing protein n=1 Tax=Cohnella nanjingensis TaxID=1387779 RepID=A0A7X0RW13_9BACL|nr:DUF1361 domain-containing protein [Cohnella nanjingensis]MBB6673395.1 DUF1361 domain-containing protein [Cohnella nanjingensis]